MRGERPTASRSKAINFGEIPPGALLYCDQELKKYQRILAFSLPSFVEKVAFLLREDVGRVNFVASEFEPFSAVEHSWVWPGRRIPPMAKVGRRFGSPVWLAGLARRFGSPVWFTSVTGGWKGRKRK